MFCRQVGPIFLSSKPPHSQRRSHIARIHIQNKHLYRPIYLSNFVHIKQSKPTFSLILLSLNEFVFICATVYHCQLYLLNCIQYIWHRTSVGYFGGGVVDFCRRTVFALLSTTTSIASFCYRIKLIIELQFGSILSPSFCLFYCPLFCLSYLM